MPDRNATVLRITDLTRQFGGVAAVDHVTLEAYSGEALGIIGPNGAGKSTFVGLISGAVPASSGEIEFCDERITHLQPHARTRLGIGRTYQIPRPFTRMTVRENLELAAWHAHAGQNASKVRDDVDSILQRTGLADAAQITSGNLPLLRRKRLELARALALRPRLLLLDEIGAGLVEAEIHVLIDLILAIKREVETLVVIEHVMDVITACCERTAVLASGRLLTIGTTHEVLRDPQVAAVYLGTAASTAVEQTTQTQAVQTLGDPLLTISQLAINYGGVHALRGVDLEVRAGHVVTLLGANGAGKTSLARAVSGIVPIASGDLIFVGQTLRNKTADQITQLGIGHCMEGRHIFSRLSVEENLLLALPDRLKHKAHQRLSYMYQLFPALAQRRHKPGTEMSGGQQQMLAIARALMTEPRLVIFDEISLGLAPVIVDQLYAFLAQLRAQGMAILLIEQSVERALSLADYAYVLAHGEIRLQGKPAELLNTPALRALYVGESVA